MHDILTKTTTVHISDKSNLNISFNLCQCGITEVLAKDKILFKEVDTFSIAIVNSGTGLLETNALAYKITKGQGYVFFTDESYTISNIGSEPLSIVWLAFTGYHVEYYLNRANIFKNKPIFSEEQGKIGEKINYIYATSKVYPNRYCKMMAAIFEIFSILIDLNPVKQIDTYSDSSNYYAAKAVQFIEHNYATDISVENISAYLEISRKQLYAIFNEVLKTAPRQYLICYRLEKACKRLKATKQSILEIAESVGYSSQFYFAKEFKRNLGVSPSEYRKNPSLTEVSSYSSFKLALPDDKKSLYLAQDINPFSLPVTVIKKTDDSL